MKVIILALVSALSVLAQIPKPGGSGGSGGGGAPSGPAGACQVSGGPVFAGNTAVCDVQLTSAPSVAPTVITTGTGTTPYDYACVPFSSVGPGLQSSSTSVLNASPLVSPTNTNSITCPVEAGVLNYTVVFVGNGTTGGPAISNVIPGVPVIDDGTLGQGVLSTPNRDLSVGIYTPNLHALGEIIGPLNATAGPYSDFSCQQEVNLAGVSTCAQSSDIVIDPDMTGVIWYAARNMFAHFDSLANSTEGVGAYTQAETSYGGADGGALFGSSSTAWMFGAGTLQTEIGLYASATGNYNPVGGTVVNMLGLGVSAEAADITATNVEGINTSCGGSLVIITHCVGIDTSSTPTGATPNSYGMLISGVSGGSVVNVGIDVPVGVITGIGQQGIDIEDPSLNNTFAGGLTKTPMSYAAITALTLPDGWSGECSDCQVTTVAANVVSNSTCKTGGTVSVPVVLQGATLKCAYLP